MIYICDMCAPSIGFDIEKCCAIHGKDHLKHRSACERLTGFIHILQLVSWSRHPSQSSRWHKSSSRSWAEWKPMIVLKMLWLPSPAVVQFVLSQQNCAPLLLDQVLVECRLDERNVDHDNFLCDVVTRERFKCPTFRKKSIGSERQQVQSRWHGDYI